MPTVYIVDDDPVQVEVANICLSKEGFTVKGFCDPFLALTKAIESPPDLMLVDQFMPQMEGLKLIKELRKAGVSCKFVLMSGMNMDKLRSRKNSGICKYITKPDRVERITEGVKEVLH